MKKMQMNTAMQINTEMRGNDFPKTRVLKDGTKMYYKDGFLHRDPYEGPAIERPGKDDISDCVVRGIQTDQRWFRGRMFQSLEDALAVKNSVKLGPTLTPPGVSVASHTAHTPEGAAPVKPKPQYMADPVQEAKPKKRDMFDRMADRVKGTSMADLQKLYSALASPETLSPGPFSNT